MLLNNRYRILKTLGEGGCGQTFLAEDVHLPSKRWCVVKQLKPKTQDPEVYHLIQERFQREAVILEKLGEENDQIPELYAYFTEAQQFYLVQQFIKGSTLTEEVKRKQVIDEAVVREMVINLLPVLVYIHSQGIIHRDINPNNIILRQRDGKPVLIDFGVVKEMVVAGGTLDGELAGSTIVVGTSGYMPPEQAAGRPVYASDLYSLASTAIHLLTGKNPRGLIDPLNGEIRWQPSAPAVSREFAEVLDKALADTPRHRYATAQQMLDALLPSRVLQERGRESRENLLAKIPQNFRQTSQLAFSHDGGLVAYRAERNGKQFVVVGDKAGPEFDYVRPPSFNANGELMAYAASLVYDRRRFTELVVIGEHKGPEFSFVGSPVWSLDGRSLAHPAGEGDKRFIVVGNVKGTEFDFIGTPVWSADGSVAYAATLGDKWFIAWMGKRGPEFDYVAPPVFNSAGNALTYPARLGDGWFIVFWNKRGPEFDYARGPVFSPDSSALAYAAEKGGKQFIVVHDKLESKLAHPDVTEQSVTDDAQFGASTTWIGEKLDYVGAPVWNASGDTLAYAAEDGRRQFVITGDRHGPKFDRVRQPVWSPSGDEVAYAAKSSGRWLMVLGQRRGPEFNEVGQPSFSFDDARLCYGARSGREIWWKVIGV
jgi:serine/threonine protein kinase